MNTAENINVTRSQKNYEKVRSLVIQMSGFKNTGVLKAIQQRLPFCIMPVDSEDSSRGYFVLNIHGCRLGQEEDRKVTDEDITHWHDLNLSGLMVAEDGNYYFWTDDEINQPWRNYKKMESYRQQLINVFYVDSKTAMKGREEPYRIVV